MLEVWEPSGFFQSKKAIGTIEGTFKNDPFNTIMLGTYTMHDDDAKPFPFAI